ncbi:hypothetical protein EII29_09845 [Leptotrichia sp. OH3620_COT-345]|uniref:hypothetical protein n=1 Tax=Leptotrichia sp. OH3620_COT-345 TaxID=2491048 RepID=UPI000F653724|nr:hypothetical protein [Leptotrichia sp. OH3620_COT-345]RRD38818.1 hypothetical protein EII29_09845 [Leptotrichia sp. OH3620_COT-345]
MDLKKLIEEREKYLKEQEEKKYLNIKIERYSEPFKLRKPTAEEFLDLCAKKLGIKDFNKKEINQKLMENPERLLKDMSNFIFTFFIEPNFEENSAELMAELNVESRGEIIREFFELHEIANIFKQLVEETAKDFEKGKNEKVEKIKKK